ncbi:hypothetical protein ACWGI0_06995 [Streptomyces sp. NPDC054802]
MPRTVAQEWERHGLLVRGFPGSGLRGIMGRPEANDLLVAAAKETARRAPWPAASGVRAGVTPDR